MTSTYEWHHTFFFFVHSSLLPSNSHSDLLYRKSLSQHACLCLASATRIFRAYVSFRKATEEDICLAVLRCLKRITSNWMTGGILLCSMYTSSFRNQHSASYVRKESCMRLLYGSVWRPKLEDIPAMFLSEERQRKPYVFCCSAVLKCTKTGWMTGAMLLCSMYTFSLVLSNTRIPALVNEMGIHRVHGSGLASKNSQTTKLCFCSNLLRKLFMSPFSGSPSTI
jgi:hypothetical protein